MSLLELRDNPVGLVLGTRVLVSILALMMLMTWLHFVPFYMVISKTRVPKTRQKWKIEESAILLSVE